MSTTGETGKPRFALYFRGEADRYWTIDGQAFDDREEAERRRQKIVGQARGRLRVAEAVVIEYGSAQDVRLFVPVGKESEAARATSGAARAFQSFFVEGKQYKAKAAPEPGAKRSAKSGAAGRAAAAAPSATASGEA